MGRMREQYRDILEDALAASANREDFDEMLLRATKRHLPVKYHSHFISMLEEILAEAERKGLTNRQSARAIVDGMSIPTTTTEPVRHAPPLQKKVVVGPTRRVPVAETIPVPPKEVRAHAEHKDEKAMVLVDADSEPPGDASGPDAPKILDLGGVRPDTLSPEIKDKLSKLVKARKQKADWEDGSGEQVDNGLFFRGTQRCPPQVLTKKPDKVAGSKEEAERTPAPADGSEEE